MSSNRRFPDWDEWKLSRDVELWQAVALSLNIDPHRVCQEPTFAGIGPPFGEDGEFEKRLHIAMSQTTSPHGELHAVVRAFGHVAEKNPVGLPEFAEWALSIGWAMPDEMKEIAQGVPIREAFAFDPDSATYPPELDTAFTAWRAVSRGANASGTPKQQLIEWLKNHNPKLSDEARERIATVCNWQQGGGRPKN